MWSHDAKMRSRGVNVWSRDTKIWSRDAKVWSRDATAPVARKPSTPEVRWLLPSIFGATVIVLSKDDALAYRGTFANMHEAPRIVALDGMIVAADGAFGGRSLSVRTRLADLQLKFACCD